MKEKTESKRVSNPKWLAGGIDAENPWGLRDYERRVDGGWVPIP